MAKKALDFAVLGGDVIYSDSVAGDRKNPTAVTREKWAKYRENLRQQQLPASYEQQPVSTRIGMTTGWDSGFYPTPSNQALFAAGLYKHSLTTCLSNIRRTAHLLDI